MQQLTELEAKAFLESRAYVSMSDQQKAEFQILQERLCMPEGVFQNALSITLGRSVSFHEINHDKNTLKAALFSTRKAPKLYDIVNWIPRDLRLYIFLPKKAA